MSAHRKLVKIKIDKILQKVKLNTTSEDQLKIIQNNQDIILYIINELLLLKNSEENFKHYQDNFKRAREEGKTNVAKRIRYNLFLYIITRIINSVHGIENEIHVSEEVKEIFKKHVALTINGQFFDYESYFKTSVPAYDPVKSALNLKSKRNALKGTTPFNEVINVKTSRTKFVKTMKEIAEKLLPQRESIIRKIIHNNESVSKNEMKSILLGISNKITTNDLNNSYVNDTLESFTSNGSFNKILFMEFLSNELERGNSAFVNLKKKQNLLKKTTNFNEVITSAQTVKGGKKVRKSTLKKNKKVRKHKGIYQTGPKKGKLKPGFKYSGKKTKTGLKIIIKVKK